MKKNGSSLGKEREMLEKEERDRAAAQAHYAQMYAAGMQREMLSRMQNSQLSPYQSSSQRSAHALNLNLAFPPGMHNLQPHLTHPFSRDPIASLPYPTGLAPPAATLNSVGLNLSAHHSAALGLTHPSQIPGSFDSLHRSMNIPQNRTTNASSPLNENTSKSRTTAPSPTQAINNSSSTLQYHMAQQHQQQQQQQQQYHDAMAQSRRNVQQQASKPATQTNSMHDLYNFSNSNEKLSPASSHSRLDLTNRSDSNNVDTFKKHSATAVERDNQSHSRHNEIILLDREKSDKRDPLDNTKSIVTINKDYVDDAQSIKLPDLNAKKPDDTVKPDENHKLNDEYQTNKLQDDRDLNSSSRSDIKDRISPMDVDRIDDAIVNNIKTMENLIEINKSDKNADKSSTSSSSSPPSSTIKVTTALDSMRSTPFENDLRKISKTIIDDDDDDDELIIDTGLDEKSGQKSPSRLPHSEAKNEHTTNEQKTNYPDIETELDKLKNDDQTDADKVVIDSAERTVNSVKNDIKDE